MKTRSKDPPRSARLWPGQQESPEPQPGYCRRQGKRRRKEDGRKEGGGGGDQARATCGSERRRSAVAMAVRHLQPSEAPSSSRAVTGGQRRQVTSSRPPRTPASASRPAGSRGCEEPGTHEEEVCDSATLRTGRKDSRPSSAGAGRGWRRRGTAGAAHVPSCCAAGGFSCSPQVASHPGTRRRSAASAAADAAPRHKHQTSGGGDASPVRWELPEAAVVALARRLSSEPPQAAQLTHPGGENGRHALRVSRSFHSGRDSWASGGRQAGVHTQRRRVGRPRVRASAGGRLTGRGSAPCWWRLVHAVLSGHTPTLGPVRWLKR